MERSSLFSLIWTFEIACPRSLFAEAQKQIEKAVNEFIHYRETADEHDT